MVENEGEEIKATTDDNAPEVEDTPTEKQQMETLQAKLEVETKAREKAESSVQGLRGSLEGKDKQLNEQAGLNTRMDGFEETQRVIAGMLNERMASGDEVDTEKRTDYAKQFDGIQEKQKKAREAATVKAQQDEYDRQANTMFARAKEAFKDDEEGLEKIEDLLMSGRAERAEARIAKAEKKETKVETKETDEQIYDRMKAQKDKDAGLLKTDNALPSGVNIADAEFKSKFGSGELPYTKENKERAEKLIKR